MNDKNCCSIESASETFDLIVVGAGSAGFSAAITGAERGAKVVLVGGGTIGGTCVNIGCVPSKNMIRAAETLHQARAAHRFGGITASAEVTDWAAIMSQKDELVTGLRQSKYADLIGEYETLSYIEGTARVVVGGVEVDGRTVKAEKIIITTGARASIPPIEGIDSVPYLTSTEALALEEFPESMIVIGGGVIGCELGQMFARMGTKVTLLCRSQLLPHEEPEISEALKRYLIEEGIDVVCGAVYKTIEQDGSACLCYQHNGETHHITAQHVLLATGRTPNSKGFGLEELGVSFTANGGIEVSDAMETSVPGIYAAGDVTGKDMFVYMAAYGAKLAARNALDGNKNRYDNTTMPAVVFTDPQVARVGLTEAEARSLGMDVRTSILPLQYVPRALAARDTRGLIKMVAESGTDKLLGLHVLAPEGADTIQTGAIALRAGMRVKELGEMVYPYLTTVEGIKLAAQTFAKDVEKLSCCAG